MGIFDIAQENDRLPNEMEQGSVFAPQQCDKRTSIERIMI
jgi:hypothetical protein